MKLTEKEDGVKVLDLQGYSDYVLQLTINNFLKKMELGDEAEIVFDDPDSYEAIEIALRMQGYTILDNTAGDGTYRLRLRRKR